MRCRICGNLVRSVAEPFQLARLHGNAGQHIRSAFLMFRTNEIETIKERNGDTLKLRQGDLRFGFQ